VLPPGFLHAHVAMTDASFPARLVQGKDVIPFIESLVVGDVAGLADGTGSLSVMTNERGGIIDDTVITKVRCYGNRAL
jgi:aminomethyltransferase